MSCIAAQKIDDGESDCFLLDGMTTEHLLETETTGISCQNRFKSQRVAFDLPYRGISKRRSMNVSPILQHFSQDGGGFPLAAKHQFKPGPLGA